MKWYEWGALGAAAVGFGWAATRRRKRKPKPPPGPTGPEPWEDDTVLVPDPADPQLVPVAFTEVGAEVWVRLPPSTWQVETVDTMSGVECVVVGDLQTRPDAVYVLLRPTLATCRTTVRFTSAAGLQLRAVLDTGFEAG